MKYGVEQNVTFCFLKGFDIQMKGPDLLSHSGDYSVPRGSSKEYRIIQQKPGYARSADVFLLDPDMTYRFRIIPKARLTDGEPSKVHRIGPGMAVCLVK